MEKPVRPERNTTRSRSRRCCGRLKWNPPKEKDSKQSFHYHTPDSTPKITYFWARHFDDFESIESATYEPDI